MERWLKPVPARWGFALGAGLLTLMLSVASFRVWAVEPENPAPAEVEKPTAAPKAEKKDVDAAKPLKREELRYGGKDFNQWRRDLLTELKGSIRVDGMRAFAAFGANGYGSEATEAILEIMRGYDTMNSNQLDDDGAVVKAGYRAIEKIGAVSVPALSKAAKNANRNIRRFAIEALGSLGTDARSAVPVLLGLMKHDDVETRRRAILAVDSIDLRAKGVLTARIEALKDKDDVNRSYALNSIHRIGKDAKPAIPALIALLDDKSEGMRIKAIRALKAIGAGKEAALPVSRLIRDKNFQTVQEAYGFLQDLGAEAKDAVPTLIAELKERSNANFHIWTVNTLASIGPAAKEAIPILNEYLRDGSQSKETREQVVQALRAIDRSDKR